MDSFKNTSVKIFLVAGVFVVLGGGIFLIQYLSSDKTEEAQPSKEISQQEISEQEYLKAELFELGERRYRKEITIENVTDQSFANHPIALNIDTQSLIEAEKLSLDCSDIKFLDSDKSTELLYWMANECGQDDTKFWVRIPNLPALGTTLIYAEYGNNIISSGSSFDAVFQNQDSLVAWYQMKERSSKGEVLDFSGNGNTGTGVTYDPWKPYIENFDRELDYVIFGFAGSPGLKIAASDSLNFDKKQGTIEMWIKPWLAASEHQQKLLTDSNNQIELGIQPDNGNLYFYPSQAESQNYNLISKPFETGKWTHFIVTWDHATKKVVFYVDGVRKSNTLANVPTEWNEIAKTGDWTFGDSAFNGYLDGIRVYNKAITENNARHFYLTHTRDVVYPEVSLGQEEVLIDQLVNHVPDYTQIRQTEPDKDSKINLVYATAEAMNYYGSIADGTYDDETGKTIYLLSKHSDKPTLMLGVPSHFYAYEGNEVSFTNPLLLTDIGFKINDRTLIKNIQVSFSKIKYYNFGAKGILEKFAVVSAVCACGPYYGYSDVGGSDLVFVEEKDGISWYRLNVPVYVDPDVSFMQLYYLPNGKEGMLSLAIADMIFLAREGEQGKYIRTTILPQLNIYVDADNALRTTEGKIIEQYEVYLANAEKGFITFQERNGMVSIVFENRGDESLTLDAYSLDAIRKALRWKLQEIGIKEQKGDTLASFSFLYDYQDITGRTIKVGESYSIPLIETEKLEKDKEYIIFASVGSSVGRRDSAYGSKIVHWVVGDDPYYRPQKTAENIVPIYRVQKDQSGTVTFEKFE